MAPTVSIIVPSFNLAKHLRRRLDSILNQEYQDFEIILLDDCSSDNSLEILNEYSKNPKVSQLVVNETNSGSPFIQWNKGISMSTGKYIWIAEVDDFCEISFLRKLVSVLETQPTVAVALCDSTIINEQDKKIGSTRLPEVIRREGATATGTNALVFEGEGFLVHMLSQNRIRNASSVLFRRSSVNPQSEFLNYRQAGDMFFWCELLLSNGVAFVEEHLNYWRKSDTSVSGRNRRTCLGIHEIYRLNVFFRRKLPALQNHALAIDELLAQQWANWRTRSRLVLLTSEEKRVLADAKLVDNGIALRLARATIKEYCNLVKCRLRNLFV